MLTLKIAIADRNDEYLERLAAVLDDYTDLRLFTYDDTDSLTRDIEMGKFQVLLLDPSMYRGDLPLDNLAAVIILSGDSRIPSDCERMPKIRKYQRISAIYQRILEICSELIPDSGIAGRSGAASVISFCSPIGGCGKTTAALIAAAKLASLRYRVFYLNLESFPSDGCYLPQDSANGMSALLERINQTPNSSNEDKQNSLTMFMQSCLLTKADGFYYMKHFDSPNDYDAMSVKELETLITIARKSGSFDVVIVDSGSTFDEKLRTIFKLSDQIVLVEKPDPISVIKLESFYSQNFILDEFGDKMKRLLNFDNGQNVSIATNLPRIGRMSAVMGADSASLIINKSGGAEAEFARLLME
ncbi:MAG: hypothetical protein IJ493_08730 [Clostridia bacterium]|nr:hypothetical protein [Clostridia bacterium]